jgi:arylsulfatase A-like enzyme
VWSEPGEKHTDHLLASDAEWILERCARESRPFFLAVGFYRPHTPYVAPQNYFEGYPVEDMELVTGVAEDVADIPAAGLMSQKAEHARLTDALRREARQAYYASVTFMDEQVGRVLDALERLQLSDNTLVVFTSDHGYHLGEHGLWQKQSLFEESARVPLIIAGAGVEQLGATCHSPVSQVDLYPTLAAMCGIEPQFQCPGQNLEPMLGDATQPGRGWALTQVARNRRGERFFGYSLRTARWRLTLWDDGAAGSELYDHSQDPRELNNLAKSAEHAEVREQLTDQLRQAIRNTLPDDGEPPQLRDGVWAPNLTAP